MQSTLRGPGGPSLIRANVGQTPIGVGVNFNPRAPGAGAPSAATGTRIIRLPPSALAPARPGGGGIASQRIIRSLLPDGYGHIFKSNVFGPSGFWTMAPLCCNAKFDPFLSLDCAPPWRNPRIGRDQILPPGNTDQVAAHRPETDTTAAAACYFAVGAAGPRCRGRGAGRSQEDRLDARVAGRKQSKLSAFSVPSFRSKHNYTCSMALVGQA